MPKPTPATPRSYTADRGPPGDGPPLGGIVTTPLSVGEIGPNRSVLPDGSVLCRNVPISRTGWYNYAPGEVPIEPPKAPMSTPVIYIHRAPEELFSDEAMRSFIGVAITHEHPPVPVTPQNFSHLAKGFVLRVWRGEGEDSDCLMADLIIKDRWTIDRYGLANGGLVSCEVSCGYEAEYVQTGDGQGAQVGIIGNHLALVEKGRCGPRCAIGDEDTLSSTVINEDSHMTTSAKPGGSRPRIPLTEARARVADALADLDAAEQPADQGIHVHVHMGAQATKDAAEATEGEGSTTAGETKEVKETKDDKVVTLDAQVEQRFATIEKGQKELQGTLATILQAVTNGGKAIQPKGEEDLEVVTEATATMDSAALANGYQEFLSQAEVLVPGFKLPTFDAAAKRHATVDRMCQGRRLVLGALQANAEGATLLTNANGGKEFDVISATCPDVAIAFKAAAKAKAEANNRASTGDSSTLPPKGSASIQAKRPSMAEVNAQNKKFWESQGPRA